MFCVFFVWVDYLCGKREVERSFRLANAGDIRSTGTLCNELIFWGDGSSDLSSRTCKVNRFDVYWVEIAALSFLCECDGIIRFQLDFTSVEYNGRVVGKFLSVLSHKFNLL